MDAGHLGIILISVDGSMTGMHYIVVVGYKNGTQPSDDQFLVADWHGIVYFNSRKELLDHSYNPIPVPMMSAYRIYEVSKS